MASNYVAGRTINELDVRYAKGALSRLDNFKKKIKSVGREVRSIQSLERSQRSLNKATQRTNKSIRAQDTALAGMLRKAEKSGIDSTKSVVSGLTPKLMAGKASKTALADQLREEDRVQREYYRNKKRQIERQERQLREFQDAASKENLRDTRRRLKQEASERQRRLRIGDLSERSQFRVSGMTRLNTSQQESYRKSLMRLNRESIKAGISVEDYRRQLGRLERKYKAISRSSKPFLERLNSMRTLMMGGVVFAASQAIMSIGRTGMALESISSQFLLTEGTMKGSIEQMRFVREESQRMGVSFQQAADGYAKLLMSTRGTMGMKGSQQLFTALSEFSMAAGVDNVRQGLVIRAIGQIAGKGVLMAEEVKNQLLEQVPAMRAVVLEAAGFEDSAEGYAKFLKEMEKGNLLSANVLPKLAVALKRAANESGAFEKRSKSLQANVTRLQNSFNFFQKDLYQGGFHNSFNEAAKSANRLMDTLKPFLPFLGRMASAITYSILLPFEAVVGIVDVTTVLFNNLGRALDRVFGEGTSKMISSVSGSIVGFGAAIVGLSVAVGVLGNVVRMFKALNRVLKVNLFMQALMTGGLSVAKMAAGAAAFTGFVAATPMLRDIAENMLRDNGSAMNTNMPRSVNSSQGGSVNVNLKLNENLGYIVDTHVDGYINNLAVSTGKTYYY